MNDRMTLLRLDTERQTIPDADVTLDKTPHVVGAIAKHDFWNGIVYSRFMSEEEETVISGEIGFFTKLRRSFEWKILLCPKTESGAWRLHCKATLLGFGRKRSPGISRTWSLSGVASCTDSTCQAIEFNSLPVRRCLA